MSPLHASDSSHGAPLISVVIPAFNRVAPLRETLRSVFAAGARLPTEIVVVDDGSTPPLSEQLKDLPSPIPLLYAPQQNQGSIAARQHGLSVARGAFVTFLDSDDLVHPDKLAVAVEALQAHDADVVYDDVAEVAKSNGEWIFRAREALRAASDPAEFYLRVQPVPHSPTYRRSYLLRHLTKPVIPVRREFDPAGDVWLYYNLAPFPAKIQKIDRALTAIGVHEEDRFSQHWERIAVAALHVMESFAEACPTGVDTVSVRQAAGECAFDSWRRLPKDFDPRFRRRTLALWQRAPRGSLEKLGGPFFRRLARLLGPERAGRLLRLRNGTYAACRTIDDRELAELLR